METFVAPECRPEMLRFSCVTPWCILTWKSLFQVRALFQSCVLMWNSFYIQTLWERTFTYVYALIWNRRTCPQATDAYSLCLLSSVVSLFTSVWASGAMALEMTWNHTYMIPIPCILGQIPAGCIHKWLSLKSSCLKMCRTLKPCLSLLKVSHLKTI